MAFPDGTLRLVPGAVLLASLIAAPAAYPSSPVNLRQTPVVEVFQHNRAAVVNINTTQTIRQRFGPFEDDPFFRQFFDVPDREVRRTSLGSGFLVHPEGYIVTNAHVVEAADEVEVVLSDATKLPARVLAADPQQDLAVLKVEPPGGKPLPTVTLGDSSDLMVGEPAIAIGNPLGYDHSVTAGIISAVNRTLTISEDHQIQGLIQTDAPINPGNSGGPLLNAYGQVIGITSAIRGDAQSIGFAIPVSRLRQLIPQLLNPLAINHTQIDGQVQEQTTIRPPAELGNELRWVPAKGQAIRLTAINGRPVGGIVAAYVELLRAKAGSQLEISGPDGKVTVAVNASPMAVEATQLATRVLGLKLREITPADRRQLRLGRAQGVLVEAVQEGSPAAQGGIEPGDVVIQIGRYRVGDLKTVEALLQGAEAGAQADLLVMRGGRLGRARVMLRGAGHEAL